MYIERLPELESNAFRLGRHVEHDLRSLAHKIEGSWASHFRTRINPPHIEWQRHSDILDQGQLGSCTGNALTGLLGTEPFCRPDGTIPGHPGTVRVYDEPFAVEVYSEATQIDSVPGAYPPNDTGSSGLAVAKVATRHGWISGYQHAFSTSSLIHALTLSPVIVGVAWPQSFFTPSASGVVTCDPRNLQIAGGHEFLVRGYDPVTRLFKADNSWGTGWGQAGSFFFSVDTWNVLRSQRADVIRPVPLAVR